MKKLEAWNTAATLVSPIVEQHGLVAYSPGANLFVTGMTKSTEVDQHIKAIIGVADWLMDE